jgi:hypothetical protein
VVHENTVPKYKLSSQHRLFTGQSVLNGKQNDKPQKVTVIDTETYAKPVCYS